MTVTGLRGFDTTAHETSQWLRSLMACLETDDRHLAYAALRSMLHALRDRLGWRMRLIFRRNCRC